MNLPDHFAHVYMPQGSYMSSLDAGAFLSSMKPSEPSRIWPLDPTSNQHSRLGTAAEADSYARFIAAGATRIEAEHFVLEARQTPAERGIVREQFAADLRDEAQAKSDAIARIGDALFGLDALFASDASLLLADSVDGVEAFVDDLRSSVAVLRRIRDNCAQAPIDPPINTTGAGWVLKVPT